MNSTTSTAESSAISSAEVTSSASSDVQEGQSVVLTADTAKLVGRTYLNGDTLWTAFSGSGAELSLIHISEPTRPY